MFLVLVSASSFLHFHQIAPVLSAYRVTICSVGAVLGAGVDALSSLSREPPGAKA